jgi:hypothetical protein
MKNNEGGEVIASKPRKVMLPPDRNGKPRSSIILEDVAPPSPKVEKRLSRPKKIAPLDKAIRAATKATPVTHGNITVAVTAEVVEQYDKTYEHHGRGPRDKARMMAYGRHWRAAKEGGWITCAVIDRDGVPTDIVWISTPARIPDPPIPPEFDKAGNNRWDFRNRPTNSCADARVRLTSAPPHRSSIRTLRPSVQPRSASACVNAE